MLFWLDRVFGHLHRVQPVSLHHLPGGGCVLYRADLRLRLWRPLIEFLRRKQGKGQPIREDGPESHLITKKGTPTMGGLLILSALTVSTLLWARLDNGYVWIVLLVTVGFGLIGFADDYAKVRRATQGGVGPGAAGAGVPDRGLWRVAAMYLHPRVAVGQAGGAGVQERADRPGLVLSCPLR
jgi:hypothetical protein